MQRQAVSAVIAIATASLLSAAGAAAAQPLSIVPQNYNRPAPYTAPSPAPYPPPAQAPEQMSAPFQQPAQTYVVAQEPRSRGNLGGGFIEFLFGDRAPQQPPMVLPPSAQGYPDDARSPQQLYASANPGDPAADQTQGMDPRYLRQEVDYHGDEAPGTIVIDTPKRFLFLVEPGGKALRYGIGVGRPGFTWAGVHKVSSKKEWPDWVPPDQMLERQPGLPHFMAGGPNNPLGARALYLGSTLYRIHGSNEPWTIGHSVSSGCIRMRNADVIDLYNRVKVGTKVIVL